MEEQTKETPKQIVLRTMRSENISGKTIAAYLKRYFKVNNYYKGNRGYLRSIEVQETATKKNSADPTSEEYWKK